MTTGDGRERQRILVCVAWPYANAAMHLGHMAGCYLPADIFARYHRLRGNHVLMVSGSDEHGTPIAVTAEAEGVKPAEIAERYHRINTQALQELEISFDLFTRTGTENHARIAQDVFLRLHERGYVEPRTQRMPYDEKAGRFLPDRFVEGTCPNCGAAGARGDQCDNCGKTLDPQDLIDPRSKISGETPVIRETEHLFFKLSAFQQKLLHWIEDKHHWRPNVINFTRNWLKEGLNDRPITRDLEWGIRVPAIPGREADAYETKRIYVWFEAVIGYLSASVEWASRTDDAGAWEKWWKDAGTRHYYFLGKDNIPFHTIIWPSMLMAYGGLNLPYDVPANEYLRMGGAKFSKSSGHGLTVRDALDRYQVDSIRYYLTSVMPETRDSSWNWDEFAERVNNELVGVFGNLCHRTLTFTRKNFGSIPPLGELDEADRGMLARIGAAGEEAAAALEAAEFRRGLRASMGLAQAGNQYFDAKAPWKLVKSDGEACGRALHVCLRVIQALAVYTAPFLPGAARRIWGFLGNDSQLSWDEALAELPAGRPLPQPEILFAKIEPEEEDG